MLVRCLLPMLVFTAAWAFAAPDDDRPVEDAARFRMTRPANPDLPTLFLVGDSTVKCGTKGQRGWGEEIGKYFDPAKVNVVNVAIGGRSSRTFISEGRWAAALSMMKPGDAVIIQFGHNDGGPINDDSRARGSLRGTGNDTEEIDNLLTKQHEVVRTYGAYLRQYLADTRAKGATPYLCTQVPRKVWDADGPRIARPVDGHVAWARQVAKAEGVTLLDLHEAVASSYDALGKEAVAAFFADERTHTTVEGADHTARIVVGLLAGLPDAPWRERLSAAGADRSSGRPMVGVEPAAAGR